MAKLPSTFNTNEHEEMGFGVLPKGDYLMEIVESEYKPTSAGTGHYLSLKRKILDGPHKGKFFFRNLNLDNPNPKAVEIANKEFNSTCRACGKVTVEDSEELHNIPHILSIAVKAGVGNAADENTVTAIKPQDGVAIPPSGGQASNPASPTKPAEPSQKRRPVFEDD